MTTSIKKRHFNFFIVFLFVVVTIFASVRFLSSNVGKSIEIPERNVLSSEMSDQSLLVSDAPDSEMEPSVVVKNSTHIKTPEAVKAIYMSSWVASSASQRKRLVDLIDQTELNSIVLDIKDSTGKISFRTKDDLIESLGASENRIRDIEDFISELHEKNIYVIGRISVFQDPYVVTKKPEWAIKKKSDGSVWKDRKGLSFLDPSNKEVWDYTMRIARESHRVGFDEINFDYIRYPSDGDMKNINYNLSEGEKREDNLEEFFKYLAEQMQEVDVVTSADVFGLTTEVSNDMGIGQLWEKIVPHFDYISPMVYPSHYPSGYANLKNPAQYPGEVITKSLSAAIAKNKAMGEPIEKIRPWLQDFNLGATYDSEMVREQIDASYELGLSSWMLWDPKNIYTAAALNKN